jgi:hypothetical protein
MFCKDETFVVLTFTKAYWNCVRWVKNFKFTWLVGQTREHIWRDVRLLWMSKLLLTTFMGLLKWDNYDRVVVQTLKSSISYCHVTIYPVALVLYFYLLSPGDYWSGAQIHAADATPLDHLSCRSPVSLPHFTYFITFFLRCRKCWQ